MRVDETHSVRGQTGEIYNPVRNNNTLTNYLLLFCLPWFTHMLIVIINSIHAETRGD